VQSESLNEKQKVILKKIKEDLVGILSIIAK